MENGFIIIDDTLVIQKSAISIIQMIPDDVLPFQPPSYRVFIKTIDGAKYNIFTSSTKDEAKSFMKKFINENLMEINSLPKQESKILQKHTFEELPDLIDNGKVEEILSVLGETEEPIKEKIQKKRKKKGD